MKRKQSILLDMNPVTFIDKLYMLKILYMQNKLQEVLKCQNQPLSDFHPKRQFGWFCTSVSPLKVESYSYIISDNIQARL